MSQKRVVVIDEIEESGEVVVQSDVKESPWKSVQKAECYTHERASSKFKILEHKGALRVE